MWKTHGPRQRVLLVVVALIFAALAVSLLLGRQLTAGLGVSPTDGPGGLAPWRGEQAAVAVVVASAVVVLLALWIILAALPKKPAAHAFRYHSDSSGGAMTQIETGVIAKAAESAATSHPTVSAAGVRIGGSAKEPVLYAKYTLRSDADPVEAMRLVEDRLIPDMETVLGTSFVRRHVRFDVSAPARQDPGHLNLADAPAPRLG
ncbi:hypothetical protein [Arthrobacter sp. NPDC090010]|uniref:hypothetical protein n=1 Tax=Arthrobacter sp. NPDC090010 TaxID=3363942 RepID=UPI0037F7AC2B